MSHRVLRVADAIFEVPRPAMIRELPGPERSHLNAFRAVTVQAGDDG